MSREIVPFFNRFWLEQSNLDRCDKASIMIINIIETTVSHRIKSLPLSICLNLSPWLGRFYHFIKNYKWSIFLLIWVIPPVTLYSRSFFIEHALCEVGPSYRFQCWEAIVGVHPVEQINAMGHFLSLLTWIKLSSYDWRAHHLYSTMIIRSDQARIKSWHSCGQIMSSSVEQHLCNQSNILAGHQLPGKVCS